jgi:hypothetical protein
MYLFYIFVLKSRYYCVILFIIFMIIINIIILLVFEVFKVSVCTIIKYFKSQ